LNPTGPNRKTDWESPEVQDFKTTFHNLVETCYSTATIHFFVTRALIKKNDISLHAGNGFRVMLSVFIACVNRFGRVLNHRVLFAGAM